MSRAGVLVWAFSLLLASASLIDAVGVNWGTIASHPLPPEIVVGMLKDNGFKRVKIFDADSNVLNSLANTGIEVMVGIPNNLLKTMSKSDNAEDWVKHNVTKHLRDGGVNIKYVAVGNEPFLKSYNGSFLSTTVPALQNIQRALNAAGHKDIKATVPLNADVYDSNSNKPSDGAFRSDVKNQMVDIVKFLKANDAPFVVNIYPFLSLYSNENFPLDFAFFEGGKSIRDNNVTYSNVFDANFDTLLWSLSKAGVPDLKIIVGEVGWPTGGDRRATATLAKRFYDGLFKKLNSGQKGTPLRPGQAPDVYLFSLLDEDEKSIDPGDFERHWGLFRYDGQPKFDVDVTGQGQRKLVGGKGVQYMDSQWCVLDRDKVKDKAGVVSDISYACSSADCTSLGHDSSCGKMDFNGNASYAFNMYFQKMDQDVEACDFRGMAKIVKQNASREGCLFPIQIQSDARRQLLPVAGTLVGFLLLLLAWL